MKEKPKEHAKENVDYSMFWYRPKTHSLLVEGYLNNSIKEWKRIKMVGESSNNIVNHLRSQLVSEDRNPLLVKLTTHFVNSLVEGVRNRLSIIKILWLYKTLKPRCATPWFEILETKEHQLGRPFNKLKNSIQKGPSVPTEQTIA